ncbi:MAG: hypothetical protein ACP5NX_04315 [Candidatus Bilamarchaeaceae archaeon]
MDKSIRRIINYAMLGFGILGLLLSVVSGILGFMVIDGIQAQLAEQLANVAAIVTGTGAAIDDVSAQLDNVNATLGDVKGSLGSLRSGIDNTGTTITGFGNTLSTISLGGLVGFGTEATNLKTAGAQIKQGAAQLASAEGNLDKSAEGMQTLKGDLDGMKTKISAEGASIIEAKKKLIGLLDLAKIGVLALSLGLDFMFILMMLGAAKDMV